MNTKENHYKKVSTTNIQITVQVAHDRQTENQMKALKSAPRKKDVGSAKTERERQTGRYSYRSP